MQGWIEAMLAWGVSGAIHVGALVVLYQNTPSFSPSSLVVQRGTPAMFVTYEPPTVAVVPQSPQVMATPARIESRRVTRARQGSTAESPASFAGVVEGSRIVGAIVPHYPLAARRRREEGTVVYRVSVTADGVPALTSLVQSSGFSSLDRAALNAISEARFSPATLDGQGVPSIKELAFVFKLRG